MKHLESFNKFDPTNEGIGDKIKSGVNKIRKLKWNDVKAYSSKIWNSVKRESNETKQAAKILQKMIDGEKVTTTEKVFLKEQSKDLIKLIGAGITPTPIIALLVALGKKYNFSILPGDQEELKKLIEKEKEELGITIEDDE